MAVNLPNGPFIVRYSQLLWVPPPAVRSTEAQVEGSPTGRRQYRPGQLETQTDRLVVLEIPRVGLHFCGTDDTIVMLLIRYSFVLCRSSLLETVETGPVDILLICFPQ